MFFTTPFVNITHVEVEDETISLFRDDECMMVIPKPVLSYMIMLYENILLDLEDKSSIGQKYWVDENTIIYTKCVYEIEKQSSFVANVRRRVLCILQPPNEIVLKKEVLQRMLINAAISYRIKADSSLRTSTEREYVLSDNQLVILNDDKHFSVIDNSCEEQFQMPITALAKIVMLKKEIWRDLHAKPFVGGPAYWKNNNFLIKSEYVDKTTVLSFVSNYKDKPAYIRMRDKIFEKLIHIATGGPLWTDDMDNTMKSVREIYWKSIPVNTVKSIEFSENGKEFTLINEVNGDTLTLPMSALKVAAEYKTQILSDLEDQSFVPTFKRDFMQEYWTNDIYAIRTGAFVNLYRDIDCKVVRFTRLRDNYYLFVLQKKAFLKLLEQFNILDECY